MVVLNRDMRGVVSHMVGQVADFSIRLPCSAILRLFWNLQGISSNAALAHCHRNIQFTAQRLGRCCPLFDIKLDVAQQAL